VHSYEDRLDIGLISDRELIPDLWHLVDLHVDEIERLFEATGADWAVPPSPPAMRRGGHGTEAIPPSNPEVARRIEKQREIRVMSMSSTAKGAAKEPAAVKTTSPKDQVGAKKKPARKKQATAKKRPVAKRKAS